MQPRDVIFYYAGIVFVAFLLVMWRRPRKGMRLRLGGGGKAARAAGRDYTEKAQEIKGSISTAPAAQQNSSADQGARSLNIHFNYNGHSWDAHEVLGIPAGCSMDKVEEAYRKMLASVDDTSKPFIEAAAHAIRKNDFPRKAG